MSARRTIGVVIGAGPPATVAEALRAAVGLTLRGDRVAVAIEPTARASAGPDGARALATLALFGHGASDADGDAPAWAADVVELWAGPPLPALAAGGRARLHLVRAGRGPVVASSPDQVLHLPADADDAAAGADAAWDAVLAAVLAADVTVVW